MKIFAINNYNYKPAFSGEDLPPIIKGRHVTYQVSPQDQERKDLYIKMQKPTLPPIIKADRVVLSDEPYVIGGGNNLRTARADEILARLQAEKAQDEAKAEASIALARLQAESAQGQASEATDVNKGQSEE